MDIVLIQNGNDVNRHQDYRDGILRVLFWMNAPKENSVIV